MHSIHEYPLLIARNGPMDGQRWTIQSPMVIGRDPNCDIVINDRQVSRYHAKLTPSRDGVLLEDMNSKNGTHCNGVQLDNPIRLKDSDAVQISLIQQFIFFTSDATIPLSEALEQGYRIRVDNRSRKVWVLNKLLVPPLSAMQFQLLQILFENIGQVIRRQDLVNWVWGENQSAGVSDQALDALIRRLRDRLAELDPIHEYIVTVRGHGIRFDNPDVINS